MSKYEPLWFLLRGSRLPIKVWNKNCPSIDFQAQNQLRNIVEFDFIHSHIVSLPNIHHEKGETWGTVVPTIGAVIPATVGKDIGDGILACKINLKKKHLPDSLYNIRKKIESEIPFYTSGWGKIPKHITESFNNSGLKEKFNSIFENVETVKKINPCKQLGTLGLGSHFIELSEDNEENIWILIHSGSRNIGQKSYNHFYELAKKDLVEMKKFFLDEQLAPIKQDKPYFQEYLDAVNFCVSYGKLNRKLIMSKVLDILGAESTDSVESVHNFVNEEIFDEKRVLVARRGAIKLEKNDIGILAGTMATYSTIIKGKGNFENFNSCSNGCGRILKKERAKRIVDLEDHQESTGHVESERNNTAIIVDTPAAFKEIEIITEAQEDTLEVIKKLYPLMVVKPIRIK